MAIETIHFVAGLGAEESQPLSSDKLLAMSLAHKFHPDAYIFLHTSQVAGTCDNYPREYVRRVTHSSSAYVGWQGTQSNDESPGWSQQGAQMSDRLRLHALLTCQANNALYLDTDAFCVRNLDCLADIEGCAMARLNPHMIANGMIYAGKDKSFLRLWYNSMASAKVLPKSYVDWSCRMPHELATQSPGLTVLDSAKYHGVGGDDAVYKRFWHQLADRARLDEIMSKSAIVHLMGCRAITDPDSNYIAMLQELTRLC